MRCACGPGGGIEIDAVVGAAAGGIEAEGVFGAGAMIGATGGAGGGIALGRAADELGGGIALGRAAGAGGATLVRGGGGIMLGRGGGEGSMLGRGGVLGRGSLAGGAGGTAGFALATGAGAFGDDGVVLCEGVGAPGDAERDVGNGIDEAPVGRGAGAAGGRAAGAGGEDVRASGRGGEDNGFAGAAFAPGIGRGGTAGGALTGASRGIALCLPVGGREPAVAAPSLFCARLRPVVSADTALCFPVASVRVRGRATGGFAPDFPLSSSSRSIAMRA